MFGPGGAQARVCTNGHPLTDAGPYCPQCGAPDRESLWAMPWTPPGPENPPPPPPPPYGAPYGAPYPSPYPAQATNGMAIASMVLGIVWLFGLGSVLALVFGYIARHQIRARPQGGAGMALAGIILGWVGVAGFVLLVVLGAVFNTDNGYYGLHSAFHPVGGMFWLRWKTLVGS